MRLTVLGAGPAYTDREGATGACYLVSDGDHPRPARPRARARFQRLFATIDAGRPVGRDHQPPPPRPLHRPRPAAALPALLPRAAAPRAGPRARATSPPASTPSTTSRASPPRRWTRSRSGPTSADRVALEVRAGTRRPHRRELRDPGGAPRPAGRASSTAATAVAPPTSARSSSPATRCSPRSRSGPARSRAGVAHLDGPSVAAARDRVGCRPRAAHPPPDGLRPRRDGGVRPGGLRRGRVVRLAGDRPRGLSTERTARMRRSAPGPSVACRGQRLASGVGRQAHARAAGSMRTSRPGRGGAPRGRVRPSWRLARRWRRLPAG